MKTNFSERTQTRIENIVKLLLLLTINKRFYIIVGVELSIDKYQPQKKRLCKLFIFRLPLSMQSRQNISISVKKVVLVIRKLSEIGK